MLKILGLIIVVMVVLGLGSGGPNQLAQAMFHDHVENLGESITDLFKPKQDPIYPYPRNDQQRIINDLHSNHPNIEQEDVDIAYHGLVNEYIKNGDSPGYVFGCKLGSHLLLTVYLSDRGYNYISDTPKTDPPRLYIPRDDRWE